MDRLIGRRAATAAAVILLALAVLPASPTLAEDRPTVVELFSAQGCPLCPPAEAYLGELVGRAGILALSFHVDYWDYLGWRDRFAAPAFSQRQQRYADRFGLPYVYTPQIVVDGYLQASASQPAAVEAEIRAAGKAVEDPVNVKLTRLSPRQLRIEIPAVAASDLVADIVLVGFDERRVTMVESGENSGKTLVNHHVVRAIKSVAIWRGEDFDLTVPLDGDRVRTDFCAVLVQRSDQGQIIGAASVDMRVATQATAGKH